MAASFPLSTYRRERMITEHLKDADFYARFVMARQQVNPSDYGVPLGKAELAAILADALDTYGQGKLSVDELLLRPRAALHFCDEIRRTNGWFDLPDDIILRVILDRRKHPDRA
jgi:hypothetical protein